MAASSDKLSDSSKVRRKKKESAFQVGESIIGEEEIKLMGNKPLGEGMFGAVWKAECRGCECAVKIPSKPRLSSSQLRTFQEEMNIMKKISNPHCCLFMGASFNEKTTKLMIVTELCAGDMNKLILESKEKYPLSKRLAWALQAARGLTWLHNLKPQPILHRDLKLANLLYDADMNVKVADFGLSQITEGGKEVWEKRPRGSLLYMAPEVYLQNHPISDKTDVHSFAMVVWEMCMRREVYEEYFEPQSFIKDCFVNGKRPPLDAKWTDELKKLLEEMWAPEPKDRPPMTEVVRRLTEIQADVFNQEAIAEVKAKIKDPIVSQFWIDNFLGRKGIRFDEFAPQFYKFLGLAMPTVEESDIESGLNDEQRRLVCFRDIVSKNEQVTLEQFGKTTGWFGPIEVPHKTNEGFLHRVMELCSKPYFHGDMDSRTAEKALYTLGAGHFLVRFSGREWGGYTISVVNQQKSLRHCVVFHDPAKGFRLDRNQDKYWPSVSQLVADHTEPLHLLYPKGGNPYGYIFAVQVNKTIGYDGDYGDDGDDEDALH